MHGQRGGRLRGRCAIVLRCRCVKPTRALPWLSCSGPRRSLGCGQPAGTPADLAITGVTVVDVATGTLQPGRTIVVTDGRIVAVADSAAGYAPARTVDATGRFAMPGLWDMHVHFGGGDALIQENKDLLPLYVAHGITTVRDAAGDLSPSVLEWRAAVAAGTLQGPAIFTSGPKLEGIDSVWPGDLEVGSEAEVDAALDTPDGDARRLREDHGEHAHAGALHVRSAARRRAAASPPRPTCRWP